MKINLIRKLLRNDFCKNSSVVIFGSDSDLLLNTEEVKNDLSLNTNLENKSVAGLNLSNAKIHFNKSVKSNSIESIILHIGENDIALFQNSISNFDKLYLDLVMNIKNSIPNCKVALASLAGNSKTIIEMNRHIKAISESLNCQFIDISNASSFDIRSYSNSIRFARNMGLNTKTPLNDIANAIFSSSAKLCEFDYRQTLVV